MVAVDDGYRQLCPLTRIRQEAAWRGRAREHPIRVVQNGRGMRRPRKSGAGRVELWFLFTKRQMA